MKTVLMSMNKWKQLGSMQHYVYLKYSKKSNKNPPTILYLLVVLKCYHLIFVHPFKIAYTCQSFDEAPFPHL